MLGWIVQKCKKKKKEKKRESLTIVIPQHALAFA